MEIRYTVIPYIETPWSEKDINSRIFVLFVPFDMEGRNMHEIRLQLSPVSLLIIHRLDYSHIYQLSRTFNTGNHLVCLSAQPRTVRNVSNASGFA